MDAMDMDVKTYLKLDPRYKDMVALYFVFEFHSLHLRTSMGGLYAMIECFLKWNRIEQDSWDNKWLTRLWLMFYIRYSLK